MSGISTTNLASALLPTALIDAIVNERVNEKTMLAVATLLTGTAIGACKAWDKKEVKKLDTNPGNGSCQVVAFLQNLFFADPELRVEAVNLLQKMAGIVEEINRRRVEVYRTSGKKPKSSPGVYFKENLGSPVISQKLAFLFQCYLLAQTRTLSEKLPNGIIHTYSNIDKLSSLSNKIAILDMRSRMKIIEAVQHNLSLNSLAFLRIEAEKVTSCQDRGFLMSMLSIEMTHLYTPDPLLFIPKAFGSILYEYQAIMLRLREECQPVCFKSTSAQPFRVLLQPEKAGAEFSILPDAATTTLSAETALLVFVGAVRGDDKGLFTGIVNQIGFTQMIFALAAIEPPFEKESKLSSVSSPRALDEIISYRQIAKEIDCDKKRADPLVILDHVYFNLKGAEFSNTGSLFY